MSTIVYDVVQSIRGAFNWAAGNTALKKYGLERGEMGTGASGILGITSVGAGGIMTVGALSVAPALAIPFALATAVVAFTPARLQAAYIIGQHKRAQKKENENALVVKR